jgi:hypothetical protein
MTQEPMRTLAAAADVDERDDERIAVLDELWLEAERACMPPPAGRPASEATHEPRQVRFAYD